MAQAGTSPLETAAKVDQTLANEIAGESAGQPQAPPVNDETFLRRVSLDLIGQPPSPGEVTAFVLDPAADKRARVVRELLARPEFGQNWGRYWRDVILYRRSDERALISASVAEKFLTDELNRGAAWHEIAKAFITATGDVQENGATALIMAQMGEAEEVTAEVSRIFMGVQIQCAQCHDHPTDRWKRQQFHELAAFFPRIAVRPKLNQTPRSFEVVSVNFAPRFAPPGGMRRGNTEHYMPDLNDPTSKGTLMQPKFFVTGRELRVGRSDQERRETLADWITSKENPWFAKAYVNRIWAELVGEGFYEPVDDLGPDRHCSAPKTLDILAGEFVAHNHDVKWLFEAITATEAYQRQSRSRRNAEETPFAANCPQRLRADQLYDALAAALGIEESNSFRFQRGPGQGGPGQFRGPRFQFAQAFGYDPSQPRDEVAGSIPQALLLMNSPLVNGAIDGDRPGTVLGKLLRDYKDDEIVISELYLRCLGREPKPAEVETCKQHVKEAGSRSDAFEDIAWALVNSTEFLHRK
jgi:hypothetical protein